MACYTYHLLFLLLFFHLLFFLLINFFLFQSFVLYHFNGLRKSEEKKDNEYIKHGKTMFFHTHNKNAYACKTVARDETVNHCRTEIYFII